MKKFEAPEFEIHAFLAADVITASDGISDGNFDDSNIGPIT